MTTASPRAILLTAARHNLSEKTLGAEEMPPSQSGAKRYGIPDDPADRKRIRDGLSDAEKADFDAIIDRIDKAKKPDRHQRKKIRRWQQQGKMPTPSKRFRSPSDQKTHQAP